MLRLPNAAEEALGVRCLVLISSQWGDATNLFLVAANILLFGGIMFWLSAGSLGAPTQFGNFQAQKIGRKKGSSVIVNDKHFAFATALTFKNPPYKHMLPYLT